jgi:hypothetical protein
MIERSLHATICLDACLPALALPWPRCYFRLVLIQIVFVIAKTRLSIDVIIVVVLIGKDHSLTRLPTSAQFPHPWHAWVRVDVGNPAHESLRGLRQLDDWVRCSGSYCCDGCLLLLTVK